MWGLKKLRENQRSNTYFSQGGKRVRGRGMGRNLKKGNTRSPRKRRCSKLNCSSDLGRGGYTDSRGAGSKLFLKYFFSPNDDGYIILVILHWLQQKEKAKEVRAQEEKECKPWAKKPQNFRGLGEWKRSTKCLCESTTDSVGDTNGGFWKSLLPEVRGKISGIPEFTRESGKVVSGNRKIPAGTHRLPLHNR